MKTPLFIVCQNPRCGAVKAVKRRGDQRQRFCSQRCASTARHNLSREGARRGGLMHGHRRRIAVLQKVAGLSPLEAFRLGVKRGIDVAKRKIFARYRLVSIDATPAASARPRVLSSDNGRHEECAGTR